MELIITGGAFNRVWRDGADAVSAGIDKRMLAENVDHAGNALGRDVDAAYRLGLKYGITIASGDAKSLADIALSPFRRGRGYPAAAGAPPAKLPPSLHPHLSLDHRLT